MNDELYRLTPAPGPGDTFTSITGVMHYAFGAPRLLPRSAADVSP